MAALFCILRDCGQEVYGKVHKTLGVFSEKGAVEMEAVRLCWKPPTESPGSHFNPGHKGKRSGTGFLPSLLPLCYSGKNQASEPTPETPFRAAFTPPRLCSLKAQLPSPSEFCGDPFLCLMALSLTCPPTSGVVSRDLLGEVKSRRAEASF